MEQPYSVWADALNKFHTAPDWIQALWIVATCATVLGSVFCIMRGLKEIAVAALARRDGWQSRHARERDVPRPSLVTARTFAQPGPGQCPLLEAASEERD